MTANADLDARLIAAHEAGDPGVLSSLYGEAAYGAASEEARAFFLVHARVYALEAGDASAERYLGELRNMGRDE